MGTGGGSNAGMAIAAKPHRPKILQTLFTFLRHRCRVLEVLAVRRRHPLPPDEIAVTRLVGHQSVR
ncbi:MAG TPA: hypothetical protein VLK33_08930, partial [Terriglobales bacterium]|nr:hypothetical protein [Terriglobales bacterium]